MSLLKKMKVLLILLRKNPLEDDESQPVNSSMLKDVANATQLIAYLQQFCLLLGSSKSEDKIRTMVISRFPLACTISKQT